LFIGFVRFEIKQWFSAYQDQFCVWFIPRSHQSLNMFKSCFNKLVLLNCPFTSRARLTKHV